MLEAVTKVAWGLLLLIHVWPSGVLFARGLVNRLYQVEASGPLGILLVHRGALFLGIVVGCAFAMIEPGSRRLASLITGISVMGYLVVYLRSGAPDGALRTIAIVDAVGLAPLAWVALDAWRRQA